MDNKKRDSFKSNEVNDFVKLTVKAVDPKINEILNYSVSKEVKSVIDYQINSGGKRLRPMLAILSCLACGGKLKDVLYPAAGIEILHNYSLIIDDIIDYSTTRRGRPTVWAKFGRSTAECISIDYSAAVFQAANRSNKSLEISEVLAGTMKNLVEGEILDNLFDIKKRKEEIYIVQHRYKEVTLRDYFDMIGKKTASLMQACAEVGAISAAGTKKQVERLKKVGFYMGMAGQIKDDILDVFGDEEIIGKQVGKDIMQGNRGNIVILNALKELKDKDKKSFCRIIYKEKITEKDAQAAIVLIKKTRSYQKSMQIGRTFITKAKNELKHFPQSKWNRMLCNFADFVIERDR